MADSIFIDGRKDAAMTMDEANGKYYRRTTFEEHFLFLGELSGCFLSYVMPEDGTGENVAIYTCTVIEVMPLQLYGYYNELYVYCIRLNFHINMFSKPWMQ